MEEYVESSSRICHGICKKNQQALSLNFDGEQQRIIKLILLQVLLVICSD